MAAAVHDDGTSFIQMITRNTKESLVKGQPTRIDCLELDGQSYVVSKGPATVVSLEDEWYEDVPHPARVIEALKSARVDADLFSFWQRLPDVQPRFPFYTELESIAALPITSYEHWWTKQIKSRTRNLIRKAEKTIEVRETSYDDAFVHGMTRVFNETPVRQGRRFWHYGKDFSTIKQQFSRYLSREDLIGAYYNDDLIGFMMLGNAGRYAVTGQIISMIEHRDKATNNLLIARAVEICERRHLPYLVYLHWGDGSLAEFKRRCGFEPTSIPRYYVPLTARGHVVLRLGLHRGWKKRLPPSLAARLKDFRRRWLKRSVNRQETACQE
jgi:hypothetical protein